MSKFMFFLICCLGFFIQCKKENQNSLSIKKILEIHKKLDTITNDLSVITLNKIDEQLKNNIIYPDSLRAENNFLLGKYYRNKGDLDSAAVYYYNATRFVKKNSFGVKEGVYFYWAWNTYFGLTKYGDALIIAQNYMTFINPTEYSRRAFGYYFYTNTYKESHDFEKALKYSNLRISMLEKAKDSIKTIPAYITLAKLKYHYLKDSKGTFAIMNKLLKKEKVSHSFKRQIYGQYGIFKYYEGDLESAIYYYEKGLKHAKLSTKNIQNKTITANWYGNIAEAYLDLHETEKAAIYLDSMQSIGLEFLENREVKSLLKYKLRLSYLTKNNLNDVIKYFDSLRIFQDKQYVKKYNTELVALKNAYKKEKNILKEKEKIANKNIKLQKQILFLFISIFMLGTIGFVFFWLRKQKQIKQQLQMQQRLFRSQMNPHFTFNALYAIQNLIKKDPEKSKQYLLKFSRLLRIILDNSLKNYVQLTDELESLEKYMDLQLLRFPEKFSYDITLKNIEKDDFLFIPPMLIQPFIENSIEHGFSNINYQGKINVILTLQTKFIFCSIEDNGKGKSVKQQLKSSVSTRLISKFIEKTTQSKVEISNKKEQGVLIEFLIPYKFTEDD